MPGDPGPMVRRRQLGVALRAFRQRAGITVAGAAKLLLAAPSKISRIETGQRGPTLRDVRDLGDAYGLPADVRDQLMELARESRRRAWWQEASLDPALETLIGMEGAASSIKEFEPLLVPGLLQTPDYAQAVLDSYRREETTGRTAVFDARMRRRRILDQQPSPRLSVILDEAALRREVGGTAVMRKQLQHLTDSMDDIDIQLQIIPFSAGVHMGTLNGFIILEFEQRNPAIPEAEIPGVVYVETLAGGTYYDQPAEVELHLAAFAELHRSALSTDRSQDFLRSLYREM